MKSIFIATCLIFTSRPIFATLCSEALTGQPCTPDPGDDTADAKADILRLIREAKKLNAPIAILKNNYLTSSLLSLNEQWEILRPYHVKKAAQDFLYKQAIDETERLYHVSPDEKIKTVAKPYDPSMEWMSGLTAIWNPKVTDSGPGIILAYKIGGSDDGADHYGGLTTMDPFATLAKDRRDALTLPDGRVFILKGVFDLVSASDDGKGNPGILASILYHESQHFNRLSSASRDPKDAPGMTRSWASKQEEELAAYDAQVDTAKTFGLSSDDINNITQLRDDYAQDVKDGRLESFNPSPSDEEGWKYFYVNKQMDLESAYIEVRKRIIENQTSSDDALRRTLTQIAYAACANPDSVNQTQLNSLRRPYSPHFIDTAPMLLDADRCPLNIFNYLTANLSSGKRNDIKSLRLIVPVKATDCRQNWDALRALAISACAGTEPLPHEGLAAVRTLELYVGRPGYHFMSWDDQNLSDCPAYVYDKLSSDIEHNNWPPDDSTDNMIDWIHTYVQEGQPPPPPPPNSRPSGGHSGGGNNGRSPAPNPCGIYQGIRYCPQGSSQ